MGSDHVIRAVVACALAACAHDQGREAAPGPSPTKAPAAAAAQPVTIANGDDAKSAVGKVVHVSGTAEREKLGDSINLAGLSVVCLDQRFPTGRLHQTVAVEGILELDDDLHARTGPNGEISQGTAPGSQNYVIRSCKQL